MMHTRLTIHQDRCNSPEIALYITLFLASNSLKTRNTVSNAHKMIPPAPPCFVWQSPCLALENPKIIRIKNQNRRCSMAPCSEQFLKVS